MRTFVSHKTVQAEKIAGMRQHLESIDFIFESEDGNERNSISMSFTELQNRPKGIAVGWYLVKYPDGYISFSPPDAFEDGYTEAKKLTHWVPVLMTDVRFSDILQMGFNAPPIVLAGEIDTDDAARLCNEHNSAIGFQTMGTPVYTKVAPESTSMEG